MAVEVDAQRAPPALDVSAAVRRLLTAYADTLAMLDRLPPVPAVAVAWRWRSLRSHPLRLPRSRLMVRSLSIRHMERVLAEAERALRRRTALDVAPFAQARALAAVVDFRASLPARSWALRTSVLVLAILVVARLLVALVVALVPSAQSLDLGGHAGVESLFESTLGALTPSSTSFGSAVDGLFHASPGELAGASALLGMAAYLILRPAMSAFRLKRLLFNLYPHAEQLRSYTAASWSVSRASGVYELERQAFAALAHRAPKEFPLDLILPLPGPVASVYVLVAGAIALTVPEQGVGLAAKLVALGIIVLVFGAPPALRIAWLAAAWRARRGRLRSKWLLAEEIVVPWRPRPLRCRSPVLIAFASFTFPPLAWLVWLSTADDLRELGVATGVARLRKMHPALQLLALSTVLLAPFPLVAAVWHVRAAQKAAGIERPLARASAILVLVWPVLCLLLQRALNRALEAQGEPLDTSDAVAACMRRSRMHPAPAS
jgi:hypothetical protein